MSLDGEAVGVGRAHDDVSDADVTDLCRFDCHFAPSLTH